MIPFALLAAASLAPRAIQAVRALASVSKALLKSEAPVSTSRSDEVWQPQNDERRRVIFAYNALNQQTSPAGQVFDAKGQTTTTNGRTYEWDDQGRITAIVMGTQRTELAYDGDSRRTKITELTNGTVTSKKLYFWLGGSIVCERDGLQTGFPITKQYFGQGEVRGTTKLYYTFDHLGSIRELVDSAGTVQAKYSTYGERTKVSGSLDSDWGYAGLWHHSASGLDLATYRAYDATNKRWISRDPLAGCYQKAVGEAFTPRRFTLRPGFPQFPFLPAGSRGSGLRIRHIR